MSTNNHQNGRPVFWFFLFILVSAPSLAQSRIAILDFELNDLTGMQPTPAEIQRTASIKPLLENGLRQSGNTIIAIPSHQQKQANKGLGYLYDHHDLAARLGKQLNAEYVLVGRLHKPSFLFAYLMCHLVRVSDARLTGDYVQEAKGASHAATEKAVTALAARIHLSIASQPLNDD